MPALQKSVHGGFATGIHGYKISIAGYFKNNRRDHGHKYRITL